MMCAWQLSAGDYACASLLAWVISPSDERSQRILAREMLSFAAAFSAADKDLSTVLDAGRTFFAPIEGGVWWVRMVVACAMQASPEKARRSGAFLASPELAETIRESVRLGKDLGGDGAQILETLDSSCR